jgi:hypothetical protein
MTGQDLRHAAQRHPIRELIKRVEDFLPNVKRPFQAGTRSRFGQRRKILAAETSWNPTTHERRKGKLQPTNRFAMNTQNAMRKQTTTSHKGHPCVNRLKRACRRRKDSARNRSRLTAKGHQGAFQILAAQAGATASACALIAYGATARRMP